MATGFYLLDNPPARSQYRRPRRGTFVGAIGIHTTEGVLDTTGPDTGAENVAAFIVRRMTPGSYHRIVDSDSVVAMLPDNSEAFAIAADGLNRSTINMAWACRTTDLHPSSAWTRSAFTLMAGEIVDCWRRNRVDPLTAARWLTREQVLAGWPGLFHHGTVQPADRHDAFVRNPDRPALERLLVDEIRAVVTPKPEPTPDPEPEDDEMAWLYYHDEDTGSEYVVTNSGDVRFYGPEALRELRVAEVIPSSPKRVSSTVTEQFRAGDR